jgi:hypothetical protein
VYLASRRYAEMLIPLLERDQTREDITIPKTDQLRMGSFGGFGVEFDLEPNGDLSTSGDRNREPSL